MEAFCVVPTNCWNRTTDKMIDRAGDRDKFFKWAAATCNLSAQLATTSPETRTALKNTAEHISIGRNVFGFLNCLVGLHRIREVGASCIASIRAWWGNTNPQMSQELAVRATWHSFETAHWVAFEGAFTIASPILLYEAATKTEISASAKEVGNTFGIFWFIKDCAGFMSNLFKGWYKKIELDRQLAQPNNPHRQRLLEQYEKQFSERVLEFIEKGCEVANGIMKYGFRGSVHPIINSVLAFISATVGLIVLWRKTG